MATVTGVASKRNVRVDALRFLAIAMVVLTHVLNLRWEFKDLAPWLVRAMMAFNMPLFAFVSGYVLHGREGAHPLRFIKGKALALLVPYLAWITVEMPLRGVAVADWPARLARAAVDPSAGFQMWFLHVLFVAFVVFALSRRVHAADGFTALVALAIALVPLAPVDLSNLVGRVCWLYPFLALGYLSARHRPRLRRWDVAVAVAGVIAFALLFTTGWDGVAYRLAIGSAGIASLWGVVRILPRRALAPLAVLGRKTMGVYGWQMVVLPFLIVGAGWVGASVSWLLVLVVSLALTVVLELHPLTRAVFLGSWPRPLSRAGLGIGGRD